MSSRRNTKQKTAILNVLEDNHLLSAQELSELLPDINESTIYRNLQRLFDDGKVQKVEVRAETKYELLDAHGDHEHFVCEECNDIKSIYLDPESVEQAIPASGGFTVTVRGICNSCGS
jgi:Fe2+ or Zn2+ uptake regulation protein